MEKEVMRDTEGHEGEQPQKKKVRCLADYISTIGAGCRLAERQIVLGRNNVIHKQAGHTSILATPPKTRRVTQLLPQWLYHNSKKPFLKRVELI